METIRNFILSFLLKDLAKILAVFDKAHAELDAFIARTEASLLAAQAAADAHTTNLTKAQNVKTNLTNLTSGV